MSGLSAVRQARNLYSLYGLRVKSAIALPCPQWHGSDDATDVDLIESTEEELSAACSSPAVASDVDGFWDCRRFSDGAVRASWSNCFEFHVSGDGSRVLWRRLVDVADEVLFTYLLIQVFSDCLAARGTEPLHGTGIVVDGEAIALLGDSGYGKSTLAAALMRRGCRLLSDDMLVLDFAHGGVVAHPSLARLKLYPDAADAVFDRRRSLPMNRFTTKMILPLEDSEHVTRAAQLRTIFVLPSAAGAARISIRRTRGRRAMLALIKNAFNTTLLNPGRLEQQFRFASRLADAVPIKFLAYPRRLELLPDVADAILHDLAAEAETH